MGHCKGTHAKQMSERQNDGGGGISVGRGLRASLQSWLRLRLSNVHSYLEDWPGSDADQYAQNGNGRFSFEVARRPTRQ